MKKHLVVFLISFIFVSFNAEALPSFNWRSCLAFLSPKPEAPDPSRPEILKALDAFWSDQFRLHQFKGFEPPKIVLFDRSITTRCGYVESTGGPFYCSHDLTIYLSELSLSRIAALAQSPLGLVEVVLYAHEYGHHIKYLMPTFEPLHGSSEEQLRKIEHQADAFTGFFVAKKFEQTEWSNFSKILVRIGDDYLNKDFWSDPRKNFAKSKHGISCQREAAFNYGLEAHSLNELTIARVSERVGIVSQNFFMEKFGDVSVDCRTGRVVW